MTAQKFKEKHKKRRKMLAGRAKRSKQWMYIDHKPKTTISDTGKQILINDFLMRGLR